MEDRETHECANIWKVKRLELWWQLYCTSLPSASRTGRLYPPGMFLVLIFNRGWVNPRAMVGSEGNMSLKNPVTPPGIDPGNFRLVVQRTEMSARNISWGVKAAGAKGWQPYHLHVPITVLTLDAGLLARSQYPEGPATGHLDTGFSWFPCVYKRMLRWFPSFQVGTTCFSCSPPDLNFLVTLFHTCLHVK